MDMQWKGDKVTNFGARVRGGQKYEPIAIVNHIMAGTMAGTLSWFQNKASQASSHFGVGKDGTIHQYVRIENAAWTQGLTADAIPAAPAAVIRQMGVNPNLYCISIEHEGYDGELTEAQFWSSCWLHKYIQHEVERIWGRHIQLSPQFVIGHFQIDPKRKPFCPGPKFPWSRLYSELAKAEGTTLDAWEEYVEYRAGSGAAYAHAYAACERIRDLGSKLTNKQWAAEARRKIMLLEPIMAETDYPDSQVTAEGIVERALDLYEKMTGNGQWAAEALRKLLIFYNRMKQTGLL
jgi:N-acetyl-anhydromuramyl-L-alanine amidase AmpD